MGEDKKTVVVSFNKLEEGMILAKDVEQNGRILLKKDITINKQIIKRIKRLLFIGDVVIYDKKGQKDVVKKKETDKIEEEFKELALKLPKIFRQLMNENGLAMNEIREFSQKVQSELKPSSLVIKNVVLYGSGTDTIYRHGVNVAALSALLGKWLGFDKTKLNLLVYSAILHDFGKIKIDREVLDKEATLTSNELKLIKTHAQIGYKFIKGIPFIDKSVSYGVLMHHERIDGSGYPLGLKGEEIHPFAKIIAIADVFDAINSDRIYKKKKLPFEALQIVKNESLGKLDYEYAKVFLEHIIGYYIGEEVLLNTNEKCKIIQMNVNDIEKPFILKDDEFMDLTKERGLYIKEMLF